MKKTYIAPAVEINNTIQATVIALSGGSIPAGEGEGSHEAEGKMESDWNIWGSDDED